MKSFALILAVIGSSVLLAEAFTPDVHDPSYRKTTSFIEKGEYLDAPQQGTSAVHKHSDKNPHHDDSHSHEDSSEHRRHARDTEDGVDVESRRLGSGSHGRRPGSGLGSGSLHTGSGLGHNSGYHGSSGLGSGSLHTGSGLGHGSGYHGSSGLGSGSLHGSSGHHRRPSSVRAVIVEGDTVRLMNSEHSCLYLNIREEIIENRGLECNGERCSLLEQSDRHTAWKCGRFKCDILKFDINEPLPSGLVFQCTEQRSLITAPKRCPSGSKLDWAGKCRAEF